VLLNLDTTLKYGLAEVKI